MIKDRIGIGIIAASVAGFIFWRTDLAYGFITASILTAIVSGFFVGAWLWMMDVKW